MNETIVNYMLYVAVPFAVLIIIILVYDLVRFIQLLINGPYLSKYTEPISVKCTDLIEKKVIKSEHRDDSHYTYRDNRCVMRPSFSGFYNGKNLTFCRTKDWKQPTATVGNCYTIYVKPGDINCHDFYEEQEKQFLRKNRKKRILLYNLAMVLMTAWVVATVYFSIQVW